MAPYVAAARCRRGQLLGGEPGRATMREAETAMRSLGVANPVRMIDSLAPGFGDRLADTRS